MRSGEPILFGPQPLPWSLLVSEIKLEPDKACISSPECAVELEAPKNFVDRIIINLFSIICFVSMISLTLIICVATFFRYVLEGNLYGYEEWVKLMAFWLYFIGAAIGAYNRTHVSADLVNAYLPEGILKKSLTVLKNLITVGVAALFAWYGYDFFMFGYQGPLGTGIAIPKTSVWRIPLWVGYISVFIGLVFMLYYFTRDLILSVRDLFGRTN